MNKNKNALVHPDTALAKQSNDSNPTLSAENAVFSDEFTAFFSEFKQVWQPSVADKYPYKLARLVHHNYSKTKRWYVIFYAWDVSKNKMVRYRMFDPLNREKNVHARIRIAQSAISEINSKLRAGKVLGKDKLPTGTVVTKPQNFTLLQAIEYVEKQKKLSGHRETYYRSFGTLRRSLKEWLEFEKHPDFSIREFTDKDAQHYFAYLRDNKNLANKSINNFRSNLAIAFKFIEKKVDVIWKRDPLRNIDSLPVIVRKHPAFSDKQIETIKNEIVQTMRAVPGYLKPGYKHLELFVNFIYYLLARPKEILSLKVSDIDVEQNRVFFSGSASKNKIDDYVEIAPQLHAQLKRFKILNAPPEYFIFGQTGPPGILPAHKAFFWNKHHKVLEATGLLKINKHFTLYSYKHSGAVSLYKATKDIKLVQRQCRHQSIEQTNAYLRDLGVLSDYDQLKNYRGAL